MGTRIGDWALSRAYNSASAAWMFSFEMSYDGTTFVDHTGASFDLSAIGNDEPIDGSQWVKVDTAHVKTLGGMQFGFSGGMLEEAHWTGQDFPRLTFQSAQVLGQAKIVGVDECTTSTACEDRFDVSYDTNGRVETISDIHGRQATYGFDASGRLVDAKSPLENAQGLTGQRYLYDSAGHLTDVFNSENEHSTISYLGNRVSEVRQVGGSNPATAFVYLKNPFRTNVTDAAGGLTTFHHDVWRRGTRVTTPEANETIVTWGIPGDVFKRTSLTDASGITTTWEYPTEDRVETHLSSGNVTMVDFAPYASDSTNRRAPEARPVQHVFDMLGPIRTIVHGPNGRASTHTNGEGDETTFYYDSWAQLTQVTQPTGAWTQFGQYGAHGLPLSVDHGGNAETRTIDAVGNVRNSKGISSPVSPGRPGISQISFDENRNLSALETWSFDLTSSNATVSIDRRSDGRILRVVRPYGGTHEFIYDALGRQIERREWADNAWQSTTWEYDLLGRVAAVELPNGMRRESSFDGDSRMISRRLLQDGVVQQSIQYGYSNGRLTSKTDTAYGGGSEQVQYDTAGRLSVITYPAGETLTIGYDLRSRVVSMWYQDGAAQSVRSVAFTYDLANRRVQVSEGPDPASMQVLSTSTITNGRLSSQSYGNGLVRSYGFDGPTGSLTSSDSQLSGSNREATTVDGANPWGLTLFPYADTQTWGSAGVQTLEQYFLGGPIGTGVISIGPVGAATQSDWLRNVVSTGFAYNAQHNRILSGGGRSFSHDQAGFITARGGDAITHNPDGRVTLVGADSFSWDTEGRPVQEIVAGVVTLYSHGGAIELDGSGLPKAIDHGFARVDLQTGSRIYRHLDFRGNVKFVTDDSGDVVTHYEYGEYGVNARYGPGTDDRSFAQGRDLGNGLFMLGARLYDSDAARFMEPDPVFHILNQFQYAEGNPVFFWDPDGRRAAAVISLAYGAVGLAATTIALIATGPALVAGAAAVGLAAGIGSVTFGTLDLMTETGDSGSSPGPDGGGCDCGEAESTGSSGGGGAGDSEASSLNGSGFPGGWSAKTFQRWRGGSRGKGGGSGDSGTDSSDLSSIGSSIAFSLAGLGGIVF